MKHRLIATAGHVDHGKTSLLEQLTGTDADRLDEEQQRGLTIDLGFADLTLEDYRIGFIDVPGHHNFIKNMVSGVGSVQGVLFVVSATDGWQAQSREHFEIIHLLEPDFILFAITKIDRADEDLTLLVRGEIERALEGTAFEEAPVREVSSETGEGINALRDTLRDCVKQTPEPDDFGKPYCPIDRVFTVKGQGTVVTGSLSGGTLQTDQGVVRYPSGEQGRVRGLQQYHEDVDRAEHPARVAVNVPDWDNDSVERGDVLTIEGTGRTARTVDGYMQVSRNLSETLDHDSQILAYAGTDRARARVLIPDQQGLTSGQSRMIRLNRLDEEGFFRPGDRVILRDFSDRRLIGCLTVLNVAPDRSLGDTDYRAWLSERHPPTVNNYLVTELQRMPLQTPARLADGQRFSETAVRDAAGEMDSLIALEGDRLALGQWWHDQIESLAGDVADYHREYPHRRGMPLSRLSDELRSVRTSLSEALAERGCEVDSDCIRRSDFEPHLEPSSRESLAELMDELREAGLEPPDRSELESRYGSDVLEFAVQEERVVVLSEERVLAREVYEEKRDTVVEFMKDGDPKRLSELRDCLESSRQYVIPFMEYLDRQDVTVRDGDVRHLSRAN